MGRHHGQRLVALGILLAYFALNVLLAVQTAVFVIPSAIYGTKAGMNGLTGMYARMLYVQEHGKPLPIQL